MDNALKELQELKDLVEQLTNEGNDEILDYEKILEDLQQPTPELKIVTKFTNDSTNEDPFYSKEGDSGFDLRAFLDTPITLSPLERTLIPTGLKFQLPPNTELQVRPRSGMALKYGISVLNTPGTVDESYRGDVGIIAINLSNDSYTIQPGERIAQGVITNVIGSNISSLEKTTQLNETERGSKGFGSSGKE
tara:strand:+ start:2858 stop:3433 length:576 start_codon:yes stop_codon:yes gene_type:complete